MKMALGLKIIYANGTIPAIITAFLVLRYQDFCGIWLGTVLILPGFLIFFFLMPMKAPSSTNGAEQQIQNIIKAIMSVNLIAAEDFSIASTVFIIKNTLKAKPGYKNVVNSEFLSHSLP
jgi:cytochrome c biogenesis protein CcdA